MKKVLAGFLTLFALTLITSAMPETASAQWFGSGPTEECARCKKCGDCDDSRWGGEHCTFKGGCCREGGGNCNPAEETAAAPEDQLLVDIDGQETLTVRLAGSRTTF